MKRDKSARETKKAGKIRDLAVKPKRAAAVKAGGTSIQLTSSGGDRPTES